MAEEGIETAQYSCHVMGLVLHGPSHTVVVIDPNGALQPGSSMEFVSMPLKARRAADSTTVSRFDLDQRANTRKRKRRTEEGDTKQRQKQL